jgi:hypothetical protein
MTLRLTSTAAIVLALNAATFGGTIYTGTGDGTQTHVKAFTTPALTTDASFFPYPGNTGGVRVAAGDVNGDGTEDFYVGGAKDQAGALYIQQNGKLIRKTVAPLIKGGGGGQKTLASAGGQDAGALEAVFSALKGLL